MRRPLNETERNLVTKLIERGTLHPALERTGETIYRMGKESPEDYCEVEYYIQGVTVVATVHGLNEQKSIGVSKYNKGDKKLGMPFSKEKGMIFAFTRAISVKRAAVELADA
jgi:hypothetical protein